MDAFEELLSRYEKRVYGFVFQHCRNSADASEVTQETFVRAFQALDQFDVRRPFSGWLFAIARRKCIDFHRAKRPLLDFELPEIADLRDPARLLSESEDRDNLWELAKQRLSRIQFDVLWLRYVEGMDIAEIARAVRKTKAHVKVLLFRARKIMAEHLTPKVVAPEPHPIARAGVTIKPIVV